MPKAYRSSQMKRGLSFTFTLLTWATIGPAVGIGLTATGLFAWFVLKIDHTDLLYVALFGGTAMLVCAVPGQFMFFSFYFMMTGLHGIHVLVGMGLFVWLLRRASDFGPGYYAPVHQPLVEQPDAVTKGRLAAHGGCYLFARLRPTGGMISRALLLPKARALPPPPPPVPLPFWK